MSIFAKAKKARENKKGFTLVELIVVMVILAILAAILVPALTKWIDKAGEKQIVVNGRTAYLAAQTLGSEAYAAGKKTDADIKTIASSDAILTMAELPADDTVSVTYDTSGKVTAFSYTDTSAGKTATLTLTDGTASWSVN